MTEGGLPLAEQLATAGEGDFPRSVAEAVPTILIAADVEGLIGVVLLAANDEGQMQHHCMGVEAIGEMLIPTRTMATLRPPPNAA